jgi:hypothetical protein
LNNTYVSRDIPILLNQLLSSPGLQTIQFLFCFLTHPDVVLGDPELESEDVGHEVGRLPHPGVLDKLARKSLEEEEERMM